MELADPNKKVTITSGGFDAYPVDVRYVSPGGDLVVSRKLVSREIARQLVSGAKIPVTYRTNNPRHADLTEVERPNPWGWLILGVVLLAMFLYALKLIRRESR